MLYEFALTPELFAVPCLARHEPASESANEVRLIQLLRGLLDFGILANLGDGTWIANVRETRLSTVEPQTRDRLQSLLTILHDRRRLVRFPKPAQRQPDSDMAWLELAEESHKLIPFKGIVFSDPLGAACARTAAEYHSISSVLDAERWLECGSNRKDTMEMTEAEYRPRLAPLLRHAQRLTLIDPNFSVSQRRFEVMLTIVCDLLGNRLPRRVARDIYIHVEVGKQIRGTGNKDDELNEALRDWRAVMEKLNTRFGHGIRLYLWDVLESAENPHDRFILTDQVGVSTPGGLDCFLPGRARHTTWNRLSEVDRRIWLDHVDPALSRYGLAEFNSGRLRSWSNPFEVRKR